MIEGDRTHRTAGGEQLGASAPESSRVPKPRLVLDWERRAKILEEQIKDQQASLEAQAELIVGLKEELAQQDERIKALEPAALKTLEALAIRAGIAGGGR